MIGSNRTGNGSARTARNEDQVPVSAGPGSITLVESTDASVTVTGGAGPTADLSVPAPRALTATVPPGPTATGSLGSAGTLQRSDASAPAFRSDTIGASWFIDPVNGSDAKSNPGTTAATALKTLAELSSRWWSAQLTGATVTILGNIPGTDTPAWNFSVNTGGSVTFIGTLGPTTGFGGAAIDNTLFAGTVTAFTPANQSPTADDAQLNDATIPVSFTASGLMAAGVIFRQTVPATTHLYALKDLGSKTIRVTIPMLLTGTAMNAQWTNGTAYNAYQMWSIPLQNFGVAASKINYDTVLHAAGTTNQFHVGFGIGRTRVWEQATLPTFTRNAVAANCMFAPTSAASNISMAGPAGRGAIFIAGGGCSNGNGTALLLLSGGNTAIFSGAFVSQGRPIEVDDGSCLIWEGPAAVHETTTSMIRAVGAGRVQYNIVVTGPAGGTGLSGKGNTGKILQCLSGSVCTYDGTVTKFPPFNSACTTDAAPITLGFNNYTVAQLPAVANTRLTGSTDFPFLGPYTPLAPNNVGGVLQQTIAGAIATPAVLTMVASQVPYGAAGGVLTQTGDLLFDGAGNLTVGNGTSGGSITLNQLGGGGNILALLGDLFLKANAGVSSVSGVRIAAGTANDQIYVKQTEVNIIANSLSQNIALFALSPSFQSGQNIAFIHNRNAAPTGNPTSGGYMYAEAGALMWRGSSGTVTTIAPA